MMNPPSSGVSHSKSFSSDNQSYYPMFPQPMILKALLFIYERHGAYSRLYEFVAPAQKIPGSVGQGGGECALPVPGSDVGVYLRHHCGMSTFCPMVVTVARLTNRGMKAFCPARNSSQVIWKGTACNWKGTREEVLGVSSLIKTRTYPFTCYMRGWNKIVPGYMNRRLFM